MSSAGWNTDPDGNGTFYAAGAEFSFTTEGTTTLYAQWEQDVFDGDTITIEVKKDGSQVKASDYVELPTNVGKRRRGLEHR